MFFCSLQNTFIRRLCYLADFNNRQFLNIVIGKACYCTLQHTATHCNTLQHIATHRSTLQHIAAHCNTLQHTAAHFNTLHHVAPNCDSGRETEVTGVCHTLQHTATHSETQQNTARHCKTLQDTTTHCYTLQHTLQHTNVHTLQHTRQHTLWRTWREIFIVVIIVIICLKNLELFLVLPDATLQLLRHCALKTSCHAYEQVTSPQEWVMSHTWKRHVPLSCCAIARWTSRVTRLNELCHTICMALLNVLRALARTLVRVPKSTVRWLGGEVGGWGRVPFSRNFMKPTPRRKWYLTTGRRFH